MEVGPPTVLLDSQTLAFVHEPYHQALDLGRDLESLYPLYHTEFPTGPRIKNGSKTKRISPE
jgi:hypothetical protein